MKRKTKASPPCLLPCPKCGSTDVHRKHQTPGKLWLGADDEFTRRENEFVKIDGWPAAVVRKECIMHHCRVCQYEWETGVM